jgi:hypothetical protein
VSGSIGFKAQGIRDKGKGIRKKEEGKREKGKDPILSAEEG